MKKLLIAGILLLTTVLSFGHTLKHGNCGGNGVFPFHGQGQPGPAHIRSVDANGNVIPGFSLDTNVVSTGTIDFNAPWFPPAVTRVKITWSDNFSNIDQSNGVVCAGLPIKLEYFDFNKYNNTVSFQVQNETNVVMYRIWQSTDYVHWTLVEAILTKQGYYIIKLK